MAGPVIQYTRREPCSVKGCPNFVWARTLCTRHYQAEYRRSGPPCSRRGCGQTAFARGMCVRHYQMEYRKHGLPCRKRDCKNRSFSRGLCIKHYHRWYDKLLKEHGVRSLKILPARLKERIPGVRR